MNIHYSKRVILLIFDTEEKNANTLFSNIISELVFLRDLYFQQ